jgi:hypothetical protein
VQKFDKTTGARLLTDLGKAVFPIGDVYISHQGKLQLVNGKPVFLVSNGNSNGVFAKDLLVVYLDENGSFVWPEHTRQAGNNPTGVKSRIQLNAPYEGRIVAAWAEDRPDSAAIRPYAQRIDIDIACEPPVGGFGYTISDLTATFTSIASDADSTVWDFGDGLEGSGTDPVHTYFADGTYTICQYTYNACGADTACRELTLTTIGISVLEKTYQLSVSPNPGSDRCVLNVEMPEATDLSYRLLAATGQKMLERTVALGSGKQSIPVEIAHLPSGTYFLVVNISGKSATLRIAH